MLILLLCWIFIPYVPGRSRECPAGFDGMNCTRENIALRRPANQSSNYLNYTADLAVDGGVNTNSENRTCTSTYEKYPSSSWYVILDHDIQSRDIQMVVYLNNKDGERYRNLRILIDDDVCQVFKNLSAHYKTSPAINPLHINECTTPLSGRNVTITADTAFLSLCEVQIWECIDGYFGSCDKKCHCYNTSEVCDKTTGACLISGCRNGTYGTDCQTECADKRYGRNCSGTCGRCKSNEACNKASGSCPEGCQPGYLPPLCDTKCPDKKYGRNCIGSCGRCRNSKSCNKKSGECFGGCEPGYRTPMCDTESPDVADVGTIAFSTTVCVLVVIIVILTVIIIRMKLSSGKRKNPDTNSPTTPATYETLQLTEDNPYTSLQGGSNYLNT